MQWMIVGVLVALWAVALIQGSAMGGWIHLLLVAALAVIATRFFTGRRSAPRGSLAGDAWSDAPRPDDVAVKAADTRRAWIASR
jgi:hypothetical protein